MQASTFEGSRGEILETDNPLLRAANPLLDLIVIMKNTVSQSSLATLLDKLSEKVRLFEEQAGLLNVPYETIMGARYCLCTAVDEFAARAGWADESWAAHSLLVTFHNETWGGEKFFQLLDKTKTNPQKHIDLLELIYYCLAFGYMGKYQILPNGASEVERIRRELAQLISTQKGEYQPELSTNWQGVKSVAKASREVVPFWVVAVFSFLIIGSAYYYYAWKLGGMFNTTSTSVASLQIPEIKPVETNDAVTTLRLAPLLKSEIEQKLVEVKDEADRSTVIILGDGLFESGSTGIKDRYFPVLARVAQALNGIQGNVSVRGYTDNQPIRSSTFPSNWHLSQARADAVKDILLGYLSDQSRVRSEGLGETNPLEANDTPEHRARNRRVEVILYVSGLDAARLGSTQNSTVEEKTQNQSRQENSTSEEQRNNP